MNERSNSKGRGSLLGATGTKRLGGGLRNAPWARIALGIGLLICGMVLGFLVALGRVPYAYHSVRPAGERTIMAKPGPWGNLEYVPMVIAAPENILPVRAVEEAGVHWLFKGFSHDDMVKFLGGLDLTASQREHLLDSSTLHTAANGLELTPSSELFFSLSNGARQAIYKCLAGFRENLGNELVFIHASSFEDRFRDSGVSPATLSLIRKVSCAYGHYLVFSGVPCLLSAIASYEEKSHLVKALSREETLLLKLRVGPDSDINALADYWGKACWTTDVKAMLESLSRLPGGAALDIVEILPPFPTALVYTYPIPDNPLNGPVVKRDCHWTSLNFFRDPPDARYSDANYVLEHLKQDYYPIESDPRYGDVILFTKPNGNVIHSAVYLADNIVYTKNGSSGIHPWMLSTISDLLEVFSFCAMPDQKLTLSYFRNKYY
jgi:hypothetical protein